MENKILPPNTIPTKPSSIWKVWVMAGVAVGLQGLTWFNLRHTLTAQSTAGTYTWLGILAALSIVFMSFFYLINNSKILLTTAVLLSLILYIVLLPPSLYLSIGGILFALASVWYAIRLRQEEDNRLDFSVTRVIAGAISVILYGLIVLVAFNIYYNVSTDFQNNPDKFYNEIGKHAASSIPYITKAIPAGTDLNQPLDQYLSSQAPATPSPSEKQSYIDQARQAFADNFQIEASGRETIADILAQIAVNKVKAATAPYQKYLPLVFAVIIAGILYTFIFLIRWVVLLLAFVFYRLLRITGFFKLKKVQVEVEKLSI